MLRGPAAWSLTHTGVSSHLQAGCPAASAPRGLWASAVATSAGGGPCVIFKAGGPVPGHVRREAESPGAEADRSLETPPSLLPRGRLAPLFQSG